MIRNVLIFRLRGCNHFLCCVCCMLHNMLGAIYQISKFLYCHFTSFCTPTMRWQLNHPYLMNSSLTHQTKVLDLQRWRPAPVGQEIGTYVNWQHKWLHWRACRANRDKTSVCSCRNISALFNTRLCWSLQRLHSSWDCGYEENFTQWPRDWQSMLHLIGRAQRTPDSLFVSFPSLEQFLVFVDLVSNMVLSLMRIWSSTCSLAFNLSFKHTFLSVPKLLSRWKHYFLTSFELEFSFHESHMSPWLSQTVALFKRSVTLHQISWICVQLAVSSSGLERPLEKFLLCFTI